MARIIRKRGEGLKNKKDNTRNLHSNKQTDRQTDEKKTILTHQYFFFRKKKGTKKIYPTPSPPR